MRDDNRPVKSKFGKLRYKSFKVRGWPKKKPETIKSEYSEEKRSTKYGTK